MKTSSAGTGCVSPWKSWIADPGKGAIAMEKKRDKVLLDTERLIPTYFRLSLPVVLSSIVTIVYNLADTYFIARTGNALLIAGVSLCAPIFLILLAVGNPL